ncbi:MAG TPA: serine hydrolase domain-containing protein [Allosphingosinicella sp.]
MNKYVVPAALAGCAALLTLPTMAAANMQSAPVRPAPPGTETSPPAGPTPPPLRKAPTRPAPPTVPAGPVAPQPGKTFSASRFGDNLRNALDPVVVGWAYSIGKEGAPVKADGDGFARTKVDGLRKHSADQRQNIASVSKTFTAVSTLQLLHKLGLTPQAQVSPFLKGHKLGPNMTDLTFSDVMRHCTSIDSGIFNSVDLLKYETVLSYVEKGVTKRPGPGKERPCKYDNMNFALLRVLTGQMWEKAGADLMAESLGMYDQLGEMPLGDPNLIGNWNAYTYIAYMQKNVLGPIGVKGALCSDKSAVQTLYYSAQGDKPGNKSFPNNDWTRACGSGGWYLSANDMTNFMSHLMYTEKLLPKALRQEMFARGYGINPADTTWGTLYKKDGSVGAGDGGLQACMMHLPNNYDVSVVVNSGSVPSMKLCDLMKGAYEKAWS